MSSEMIAILFYILLLSPLFGLGLIALVMYQRKFKKQKYKWQNTALIIGSVLIIFGIASVLQETYFLPKMKKEQREREQINSTAPNSVKQSQ